MRVRVIKNIVVVLTLLLALSLSGCFVSGGGVHVGFPVAHHHGGPPAHAPAHGHRVKHHYHYYPSVGVYFDIERQVYFHLSSDVWHMTATLPHHLKVSLGSHVTLDMDSDRPYVKHKEHKRKYPPGHMKKKHKNKHKGKGW